MFPIKLKVRATLMCLITIIIFSMPFMTLGIGILYQKPPKKTTNLFSFLDPFTYDVWLYTGLAYLSISVLVFILSRINNDDWESSHPCIQEPEEVESIWNILNCVWLSMVCTSLRHLIRRWILTVNFFAGIHYGPRLRHLAKVSYAYRFIEL